MTRPNLKHLRSQQQLEYVEIHHREFKENLQLQQQVPRFQFVIKVLSLRMSKIIMSCTDQI